MALSFYSTYGSLLRLAPDADMSFLQDAHSEVTDALLGFVYDPLDPSNAALDAVLNPLPDDATNAHGKLRCTSSVSAPASVLTANPDVRAPTDAHGDNQRFSKRPRSCNDLFLADNAQSLHRGPVPPEFLTDFVLPLPAFGRPVDNGEKKAGTGNPSVQSAAARERRKRISEKTQELARLIPGGHKSNTAQMLQEAAKHVKFLQAQVGMLALMHTIEKGKTPSVAQDQMQVLLGSGTVQERLCAEGKCLVPKKLFQTMAKDKEIKSNALVSRDLNRFMASLE